MTQAQDRTPGWTRVATATGHYEYQFQGKTPTVRKAQYLDATDYQFLVMDVDGWLYRIPVRVWAAAEEELRKLGDRGQASSAPERVLALAEEQLRAGLAKFTPRPNTPYEELDTFFSVDAARAQQFAAGKK